MLPELCLLGSAVVALLLGMVVNAKLVCRLLVASMGAVVLLAFLDFIHHAEDVSLFNSFLLHTQCTRASRVMVGMAGFLSLFLYLCAGSKLRYEFPVVAMFAVLGAMLLVQTNHFLSFYLSFELIGIPSCIMVCFNRDSKRSSEAAVKFFILGALTSCIMLYGTSLLYGYSPGLGCEIVRKVSEGGASLGASLGCVFIVVGVLFKLSAVPFHMWAVDTYQGSPTAALAFFFMVIKTAMTLLLAQIIGGNQALTESFATMFVCVGGLSTIVGELGALRQSCIKRLLAYSNIGHLGYVLPVIVLKGTSSYAIFQYIFTYWIINAWTLSVLLRYKDDGPELTDLTGMCKNNPFVAFSLVASMISAAGVPPFPGFFAKYSLLKSIAMSGLPAAVAFPYVLFLCVAGIVPCFYCFRIAKVVYFDQPVGARAKYLTELPHSLGLSAVAVACALLSIIALFSAKYFDILLSRGGPFA
ncbi:NADH-quinone oxidoreductase subunit N [Anaplasma capra]|uniref:NADH-quinone oxidoreductase subunit N n=1 Tax=Anaplasma capra TaxID=1562740 RepID=UPI0021D5C8C1|nr:NADH-quinone oxidoreductase subunit N [Anaplasma capra]MCU7611590.1 NADH-quinone oxidoreductase subunit N [Anaplasma capra]